MIGCKCKYHSVGGAYGSNPRPSTATIYSGNQKNGQLYTHDMLCVYKFSESKYFSKFVVINDTEIVDPFGGIRPVIVYKHEKLNEILG